MATSQTKTGTPDPRGHSMRGRQIPAGRLLLPALLGVLLAAAALALAACGEDGATSSTDERPLVVTTVPIIYSLTANVAGDDVRVENLLEPGTSPHQVSFDPGQARLVSEADMLIMNGAGLEFWADDLIQAAGNSDLQVVEASAGVDFLVPAEPLPVGGTSGDDGSETTSTEPGDGHDHADEGVDPHVWLDVGRAEVMVGNISEALQELDPANAAAYEQRAQAYVATLDELDTWIRERLADLPHRDFVSFHSAFQYYADAYGLDQVAVIAEFPGKDPSPQYLAQLVELVRDLDVQAVLTEPQFSPRPAETLARETGVQTYEVDPEGAALTPQGYEELMRANTEVFAEALGGGQ